MRNNNVLQNFSNFYNQFRSAGNVSAEQYVKNLLNSGRVSQAQYDEAVRQANQLKGMLGIK